MNETRALIEAFDAATLRSERCAIATVVSVDGSSYRRPGARMLVCESGIGTGTISAGCLESDVIEHARRVIRSGEAKLVVYDNTSANDELAWGLGLGCNGIVRVLVEPVTAGSLHIEALRRSLTAAVSMVTSYLAVPPGRLWIDESGDVRHENLSEELASSLERELRASIAGGFVETLLPPVPLTIFGAGPDVLPVVELARGLGWQTEVVDPQARTASRSRFAVADKVTLARPENAGAHVTITPRTMTLLMSHNYVHDRALLRFLLASPARYIGVMGPRHRTERMLRDLGLSEASLARLHSPVGLDLGANTPGEVALSIVAEMRAVLAGRVGGMLREREGTIHGADAGECILRAEERLTPVVAA